MDAYREFKKEAIEVASTWKLFEPYKGFRKLYLKYMYGTRISCRALKKLRAYKREVPMIEAVETIVEPDDRIEAINTVKREQRPIYSLKIKYKF